MYRYQDVEIEGLEAPAPEPTAEVLPEMIFAPLPTEGEEEEVGLPSLKAAEDGE
jgi:hypothetical protein